MNRLRGLDEIEQDIDPARRQRIHTENERVYAWVNLYLERALHDPNRRYDLLPEWGRAAPEVRIVQGEGYEAVVTVDVTVATGRNDDLFPILRVAYPEALHDFRLRTGVGLGGGGGAGEDERTRSYNVQLSMFVRPRGIEDGEIEYVSRVIPLVRSNNVNSVIRQFYQDFVGWMAYGMLANGSGRDIEFANQDVLLTFAFVWSGRTMGEEAADAQDEQFPYFNNRMGQARRNGPAVLDYARDYEVGFADDGGGGEDVFEAPLPVVRQNQPANPPRPPGIRGMRELRNLGVMEDVSTIAGRTKFLRRQDTPAANTRAKRKAKLAGARSGLKIGGGKGYVFEKVEKTMFMRGNLSDYFYGSMAAIFVPAMSEGFCFPMAFMRSQFRLIRCALSPDDESACVKAEKVVETHAFKDGKLYNEWMDTVWPESEDPVVDHAWRERLRISLIREEGDVYPMEREVELPWMDAESNTMVLGNCFKHRLQGYRQHFYSIDLREKGPLTKQQAEYFYQRWRDDASILHRYVIAEYGEPIDVTSLDECLVAYSTVFGCTIHLHNSMKPKTPWIVESPYSADEDNGVSLMTRRETRTRMHVYMMVEDEHVHSISSPRQFLRAHMAFESGPCGLCDYCGRLCTDKSKPDALLRHMSHCIESKNQNEFNESSYASQSVAFSRVIDQVGKPSQVILSYPVKGGKACIYRQYCPVCRVFYEDGNVTCAHRTASKQVSQCVYCREQLYAPDINCHECYIPTPPAVKSIPNNKLYVYDIEAKQIAMERRTQDREGTKSSYHELNLLCVLPMYFETDAEADEKKAEYTTIDAFVNDLLTKPQYADSFFFAHNGGAYDVQYVLKYLEFQSISHKVVPSPTSPHRYLRLTMTRHDGKHVDFLDFMRYMPGSLKGIGEAFKLPVAKGEFPHKFNNGTHDAYVGPIPPIDTQDNWYSKSDRKTEKDLEELETWHRAESEKFCTCYDGECTCAKQKWDFQAELRKYCWLDVKVLALAARKYREEIMSFKGLSEYGWTSSGTDPYQFMTQSQIALHLFLRGNKTKIAMIRDRIRPSYITEQTMWMRWMEKLFQCSIWHTGSRHREYYDIGSRTYVDGYFEEQDTVFEYCNCEYEGCIYCMSGRLEEENKERRLPNMALASHFEERILKLRASHKGVVVGRHCFFTRILRGEVLEEGILRSMTKDMFGPTSEDVYDFNDFYRQCNVNVEYERNVGNLMKDREFFFGGRTEVFAAYVNMDHESMRGKELKYHDVCSLYPDRCANCPMPTGVPTILLGESIDVERLRRSHPNAYFGYVRCRVKPNQHDFIGLLPDKTKIDNNGILEEGELDTKLTFNLLEKTGSWHTEELYLALEHGYQLLEAYELHHFESDRISRDLFRGYVSFFMKLKIEAGGWGKMGCADENPPEESRDDVCDHVFNLNGNLGRPRKEYVRKEPVRYAVAKAFLNCLWAKFGQRTPVAHSEYIFGKAEYMRIQADPRIDKTKIRYRRLNGQEWAFKVYYRRDKTLIPVNTHYNMYIAANVTAHARCKLHTRMKLIGDRRIVYCDTDSIVSILDEGQNRELVSEGLGGWEDEHKREQIKCIYALAPKTYCLQMDDNEEEIKAKGVRVNLETRDRIRAANFGSMILHNVLDNGDEVDEGLLLDKFDLCESIQVNYWTIGPNSLDVRIPYATMLTKVLPKKVQAVYSKRDILRLPLPYIPEDQLLERVPHLEDFSIIPLFPYGYQDPDGRDTGERARAEYSQICAKLYREDDGTV